MWSGAPRARPAHSYPHMRPSPPPTTTLKSRSARFPSRVSPLYTVTIDPMQATTAERPSLLWSAQVTASSRAFIEANEATSARAWASQAAQAACTAPVSSCPTLACRYALTAGAAEVDPPAQAARSMPARRAARIIRDMSSQLTEPVVGRALYRGLACDRGAL